MMERSKGKALWRSQNCHPVFLASHRSQTDQVNDCGLNAKWHAILDAVSTARSGGPLMENTACTTTAVAVHLYIDAPLTLTHIYTQDYTQSYTRLLTILGKLVNNMR